MRITLQRVNSGKVIVNGETRMSIGKGISLLIGFTNDDTFEDIDYLANKVVNIRLFDDAKNNKTWDLNVKQMNYEVLCISQFTLYSKLKGNKLDHHHAMPTKQAEEMYYTFINKIKEIYKPELVKDGLFGTYREIQLSIDGPVTINLDSKKK